MYFYTNFAVFLRFLYNSIISLILSLVSILVFFTCLSINNVLSRRLPFVSAVASLCSSAVVARAPLVIHPLKTRHHDATTATNHSATTSLLSRCRRPP